VPGALSSPLSSSRKNIIGTTTNNLRGHAGNELRSPFVSLVTSQFDILTRWKAHWILAISSLHPPVSHAIERRETFRERSRWRNEANRLRFAIFAQMDRKIGNVSLNTRIIYQYHHHPHGIMQHTCAILSHDSFGSFYVTFPRRERAFPLSFKDLLLRKFRSLAPLREIWSRGYFVAPLFL